MSGSMGFAKELEPARENRAADLIRTLEEFDIQANIIRETAGDVVEAAAGDLPENEVKAMIEKQEGIFKQLQDIRMGMIVQYVHNRLDGLGETVMSMSQMKPDPPIPSGSISAGSYKGHGA